MTTEKRPVKKSTATKSKSPETTTTDNKAIFGPLAKYAVVAVIMVSIIVTTAIMLNKQLNTADEQIAVLENEIADLSTTDSDTAASENNTTDTSATAVIDESQTNQEIAEVAQVETTTVTAATEQAVSEQITSTSAAEITAMQSTEVESAETTSTKTPVQTQQSQLAIAKQARDNQTRIEAYKHEQKQRMTEMFARIRTLEAQQLDQYKANQDKRVERLRGQIAQQQEVIETLILRNDESLKMREANVQRNQTSREQILNRI